MERKTKLKIPGILFNPQIDEDRVKQLKKRTKGYLIGQIIGLEETSDMLTKRHNHQHKMHYKYREMSEHSYYVSQMLSLLIFVLLTIIYLLSF